MAAVKGRSGGFRIGAGAKPKSRAVKWLGGDASKTGASGAKPVLTPLPGVSCPAEWPDQVQAVWDTLAPRALVAHTLTAETAHALRDLCEAILLKQTMAAVLDREGLTTVDVSVDGAGVEHQTIKAHPLLSRYQTLMMRVETGLRSFCLAPTGRPVVLAEAPRDAFAEFDVPLLPPMDDSQHQ